MARGNATGSRKMKATLIGSSKNSEFLRLVERTEDAFAINDESAVEEVRRILTDVRTQYDNVHMEAERKEAELAKLREALRLADQSHGTGVDELTRRDDECANIRKQEEDTRKMIFEEKTKNKVYAHMRNRILKEQDILKEKLLLMEGHLSRKTSEGCRKTAQQERLTRIRAQSVQELDSLEQEIDHERIVREQAKLNMQAALQAKMDAKERRIRFDEWRHEVALDAANEAFNASAGRLRKLYAVEKLAGNSLQKLAFEQVERSQNTEDGFSKIREVTGLADVMDIVHKFLNRDVEHEQLVSSVKDAEVRLKTLRDNFDRFKRDTDGLTFDSDPSAKTRDIYLQVEEHEAMLNLALKEQEQSCQRLKESTLQIEHMKRWSNRMGRSIVAFFVEKEKDCVQVEQPEDLPKYFQQMEKAVKSFIEHVTEQVKSGKVQRRNMQVANKEFHEARRLLADKDFLKANCRVPPSLDVGRPASRQGAGGGAEDDSQDAHQEERKKFKDDSKNRITGATRKQEHSKKKGGAK